MTTSNAVYTETETQTFMDDTDLNPVTTEDGGEVQITLTFKKVDIDPGAIFDALQTLGTVRTDFIPDRQNYNFNITP